MPQREVRGDQHGTRTGYSYGCRCDSCRAAIAEYAREWRQRNPDKVRAATSRWREANAQRFAEGQRAWRTANREYVTAHRRRMAAKWEAVAKPGAARIGKHYQPHEDALLLRIASNIAAASALGRTPKSVAYRRQVLREKGLLP